MHKEKNVGEMFMNAVRVLDNVASDVTKPTSTRMEAASKLTSLWENFNCSLEDGRGPWLPGENNE